MWISAWKRVCARVWKRRFPKYTQHSEGYVCALAGVLIQRNGVTPTYLSRVRVAFACRKRVGACLRMLTSAECDVTPTYQTADSLFSLWCRDCARPLHAENYPIFAACAEWAATRSRGCRCLPTAQGWSLHGRGLRNHNKQTELTGYFSSWNKRKLWEKIVIKIYLCKWKWTQKKKRQWMITDSTKKK